MGLKKRLLFADRSIITLLSGQCVSDGHTMLRFACNIEVKSLFLLSNNHYLKVEIYPITGAIITRLHTLTHLCSLSFQNDKRQAVYSQIRGLTV